MTDFPEDSMTDDDRMHALAMRILDRALAAMNHAIQLTTSDGPAVAIEFIADFLNNTDGIDSALAEITPDDWLTRWNVTRLETSTTTPRQEHT